MRDFTAQIRDMTLAKYLLLLLTIAGSSTAQYLSHPVMVSRDDAFSTPRSHRVVADTVNVLAVMVQFALDTDQRTTGDGRFVRSAPTEPIIDAPPHNRRYFQDHLTFLENYYRKSSKGKLILRATVVDSVFTLPNPMSTYSPPKSGSNIAVGNLARETWQKVDSSGLVSDFSRYQCFIVFHAGNGRDVDLASTLGYDPTPLDIPSLYLGISAFREFYGPLYQGIPVNRGSFNISSSIVVPETENRLLPTVTGGNTLLELSINGLLCASVGNFLGLPDLFDTNTGRTAIGRFGLMDGQSIFSFAGAFPPEPSAWEKYWLGWVEPIIVGTGEHTISLPAVGLADSIYRVPISQEEYFLIENRNRDPLRNGQTVTSVFNGVTQVRTFARDTVGFNAFDISALEGTIIDVEDCDWSLPGGVSSDGTFFDGGALIWHVDEAVIKQNLATDRVNANPKRRGVDLEEADGSQDIGQQYGSFSAGSGSEEGTPLDFWYQGNSSPVFKNEFSPASYPNSYSNSGANSHVTIRVFSARGSRMSAVVDLGDAQVSLLPGFPKSVGELLTSLPMTVGNLAGQTGSDLVVATTGYRLARTGGLADPVGPQTGRLLAWQSDGKPVMQNSTPPGLFALGSGDARFTGPTTILDMNGDQRAEVLIGDSIGILRAYSSQDLNSDGLADLVFATRVGAAPFTASAVGGDSMIAVGAANGKVYFLRLNGTLFDSMQVSGGAVAGISLFKGKNTFVVTGSDGSVTITSRSASGGAIGNAIVRNLGHPIVGPAASGVFLSADDYRIAVVTADGFLYLLDANLTPFQGFSVDTRDLGNSAPDPRLNTRAYICQPAALADVDGDGIRDVVVFSLDKICAYNLAGASLDHFPIRTSSGGFLVSPPVVADVSGDGNAEVVGVCSDGRVVAYDKRGQLAPGFPLQAGRGAQSAVVFYVPGSEVKIGLAVASADDGSISGWTTGLLRSTGELPKLPWPQYQKDAHHSGLAAEPLTGSSTVSDFFPASRAYNWPNPVYSGTTFIRYFVKDNASVHIKIFDLAGDLVTEFPGPGIGGVDNEVQWRVSDVQSGIYLARIEATSGSGNGVAIVKVAVVR